MGCEGTVAWGATLFWWGWAGRPEARVPNADISLDRAGANYWGELDRGTLIMVTKRYFSGT